MIILNLLALPYL